MIHFIFDNFFQKLLAVLAAIIFWVFLLGVQNNFYAVPETVPVEAFNLSSDFALLDQNLAVQIKVSSADPIQFQKITQKDFQASIDLKDLKEGEYEVPVVVTSKLTNISIIKVEPSKLKVHIESAQEKKVALEIKTKGQTASGFEVQKSFADITEITVKGGSNLKDVKKVQAVLELEGTEDSTVTREATLSALDNDGNALEGIQFIPEHVSVTTEIVREQISKTVGVVVNLDSELSDKYKNKMQIVPDEIVIIGDELSVSSISSLTTEIVTVQDLFAGGTVKKKLILPAGIRLKANEPEQITLNFF